MERILSALFVGFFFVAVLIIGRAFLLWDWWPSSKVDFIRGTSNQEDFLFLLRLAFAMGVCFGLAAPDSGIKP